MIQIYTDSQDYGYDLYALTKSFFPDAEVRIVPEGEETDFEHLADAVCLWVGAAGTGKTKEPEKAEAPKKTGKFQMAEESREASSKGNRPEMGGILEDGTAHAERGIEEKAENKPGCIDQESRAGFYGEEVRLEIFGGEEIPFSVDVGYLPEVSIENAAERKKEIKRFFYDVMARETGRELPWGNLTGIRPTKLLMSMLEAQSLSAGKSVRNAADGSTGTEENGQEADRHSDMSLRNESEPEECSVAAGNESEKDEHSNMSVRNEWKPEECSAAAAGNMRKVEIESLEAEEAVIKEIYGKHRVGREKAKLGIEIAKREHGILESLHKKDGYSVYIGIPFCPSTCLYCSFTSFPIIKYQKRVAEYLDALKKELEFTRQQMKDYYLDSVYIGGGTPSTLSPEELDRLLSDVTTILPWDSVKEFTVEAGRADSITREKLKVLKKYPVTRISVNPQTMKDETLKLIGRHHTVSQVADAFHMAREEGFDNINMDMILGLPGETVEDVQYTVNEIAKLRPDSLTVHSLAVKRASKMREYIEEHGGFHTMDHEAAMAVAEHAARGMGLLPYYLYRQKNMAGNLENTGYAAPGKYGIYNILIMEEVQSIVALGAGSVSKRVYTDGRIERCDNVKDIGLYLEKIDEMIERKRVLFRKE